MHLYQTSPKKTMLAKIFFSQKLLLTPAGVPPNTLDENIAYRIGSGKTACLEIFPGEKKNSAKQNNVNQTFDHFLMGKKSHRSKRSKMASVG